MGAMDAALPAGLRGRYQLDDSSMTLSEGLAEYYRVNPGLSVPAEIRDSKSAAYFHSHDCTHVVFGTHTGFLNEGVNDMWTILGVSIRFRDYAGGFFATDESKEITKQFAPLPLARSLWRTLRLTPEIWRRTRSMAKTWPWVPPQELLDRPLKEIRAEYGIEIPAPGGVAAQDPTLHLVSPLLPQPLAIGSESITRLRGGRSVDHGFRLKEDHATPVP